MIRDYTKRTSRYVSGNEHRAFSEAMALSANYQHELFQSLLFSWDQRQWFTTTGSIRLRDGRKR